MDPGQNDLPKKEKPCRACFDFKSWMKMQNKEVKAADKHKNDSSTYADPECPLDKDSLGRNTWSFLHTMASYFPETPTRTQEKEMSVLIKLFSRYYPCDHCAEDFQKSIRASPPDTRSRSHLEQWFCEQHNEVNRKLGKKEFDCKLVGQRWRDGWDDGSCG